MESTVREECTEQPIDNCEEKKVHRSRTHKPREEGDVNEDRSSHKEKDAVVSEKALIKAGAKHSKQKSSNSNSKEISRDKENRKERDNHQEKKKEMKEGGHSRSDKDKSKSQNEKCSSSTLSKSQSCSTATSTGTSKSSTKKRAHEEKSSVSESKATKINLLMEEGIDEKSGVSFGDVLDSIMPCSSKSSKKFRKVTDAKDRVQSKEPVKKQKDHPASEGQSRGHQIEHHRSSTKTTHVPSTNIKKDTAIKDRVQSKELVKKQKVHPASEGQSRDRRIEHARSSTKTTHVRDGKKNKEETSHDRRKDLPATIVVPRPTGKLEDITNLLSPTSTDYKPVEVLPDENASRNNPAKVHDNTQMLSAFIHSKNLRTKVYSGKKTDYDKVPSLRDLCISHLQDRLEQLCVRSTGDTSFEALKPVVELCSVRQLCNLERHNPHLMAQTDVLWQQHCRNGFRNKQPNELESWRDMYWRCTHERDEKLKMVTGKIKLSQHRSLPLSQTKLAFVDTDAKPPLEIAKQQARNRAKSADVKRAARPSSRLAQLAGGADQVEVPNPGASRANSGDGGGREAAAAKPKKAPLMAKTLKQIRGRFRR